jgi:predicted alpha-1,2-mannosidase
VIADSVQKGIVDFDADALWDALHAAASAPSPPGSYGGRECMPHYVDYGYCPADLANGSVSVTLELAYDDFCLARLADHLGLPDESAVYDARAKGYAHLWDPETEFFRPRNADGTLTEPWSPTVWSFSNEFYVEGSAWQWSWFVPQDEPGLRALFGSDEAFVDKLSILFEKSKAVFDFAIPSVYYFHGNEPDIHAPFLFTDAGRPDLTREWTRWVLESAYRDTYDGLVGNDDAGTLAAWYVFAALGLYPTPCLPGYRVTAPLFDRATVRLPTGEVIIEAGPNVEEDPEPTWNGAALPDYWLDHEPLTKGGTLRYGD